jgi:hypothetical protein
MVGGAFFAAATAALRRNKGGGSQRRQQQQHHQQPLQQQQQQQQKRRDGMFLLAWCRRRRSRITRKGVDCTSGTPLSSNHACSTQQQLMQGQHQYIRQQDCDETGSCSTYSPGIITSCSSTVDDTTTTTPTTATNASAAAVATATPVVKHESAIIIQRHIRVMHESATVIQRHIRGILAEHRYHRILKELKKRDIAVQQLFKEKEVEEVDENEETITFTPVFLDENHSTNKENTADKKSQDGCTIRKEPTLQHEEDEEEDTIIFTPVFLENHASDNTIDNKSEDDCFTETTCSLQSSTPPSVHYSSFLSHSPEPQPAATTAPQVVAAPEAVPSPTSSLSLFLSREAAKRQHRPTTLVYSRLSSKWTSAAAAGGGDPEDDYTEWWSAASSTAPSDLFDGGGSMSSFGGVVGDDDDSSSLSLSVSSSLPENSRHGGLILNVHSVLDDLRLDGRRDLHNGGGDEDDSGNYTDEQLLFPVTANSAPSLFTGCIIDASSNADDNTLGELSSLAALARSTSMMSLTSL